MRPIRFVVALCLMVTPAHAGSPDTAAGTAPNDAKPTFQPAERAVSTWRSEAADHLVLTADQVAALRGLGLPPRVARCVKLNNYWCIKKAGWDGEIAADSEGHVAFASALEGTAVAALLLKRYYVDFGRKSAQAIISRWAPAQCSGLIASSAAPKRRAPRGLANTLRARWLAGHTRGFAVPVAGRKSAPVRRSMVADRTPKLMPTPTIAVGLGGTTRPMTLDALMANNPNAPPSRSMLGMPRAGKGLAQLGSLSACANDGPRIAAYAQKAAAGLTPGPAGDLALFDATGAPTPNLTIMMTNMARVEIGPLGPTPALIEAGIAEAFKPGRNQGKS